MGEYNAFRSTIYIVIYFALFIVIASILDSTVTTALIPTDTSNEYCDAPRVAFNNNGEEYEVPLTSTRCSQTRGAYSEETCNQMLGCTWTNTSFWQFWEEASQYCDGAILIQNLTNETLTPLTLYNVCSLDNLSDNEETCYLYGCTWHKGDIENIDEIKSTGGVLKTTFSLFTFRYDFGFTGLFNIIVNFIMFYMPLLILLGNIYFMLPFFH